MRKLTKAQIAELERDGAKVKVTPAKKPVQPKDRAKTAPRESPSKLVAASIEKQGEVVANLANELGKGQLALAEQIQTMVKANSGRPKPIPYRFIINRDKKDRLIESVDAFPLEE